MVLGQGLSLAALGLGVGLLLAAALSRLLSSFLFGVSTTDPTIYLAVPVVLLAVAVAACVVPAYRAVRVEPVVALRYE